MISRKPRPAPAACPSTRETPRAKNAIATGDIAQELDKLKSQRFCAFLDVNFKGFKLAGKPTPEPSLGENAFKEFLGSDEDFDKIDTNHDGLIDEKEAEAADEWFRKRVENDKQTVR